MKKLMATKKHRRNGGGRKCIISTLGSILSIFVICNSSCSSFHVRAEAAETLPATPQTALELAAMVSSQEGRSLEANQACFDALFFADQNKNRKIDEEDYITFVQILGPPGFASNVDTFDELPTLLKNNFQLLSCLCLTSDNFACCDGDAAHISNRGAFPGETPTERQTDYLDLICVLSDASVEQTANTARPTGSPTEAPVTGRPTSAPTRLPTRAPTSSPTKLPKSVPTMFPTREPSRIPTRAPATESPSRSPTQTPTTSSPTRMPTKMPSSAPTMAPSSAPSRARTAFPTRSPTQQPSTTPTLAPSNAPTESPSQSPTKLLTSSPTDAPTQRPSSSPSHRPSYFGSAPPTVSASPTTTPTASPSQVPSSAPTQSPSASPSLSPSASPTSAPTREPSQLPTLSRQPSAAPSKTPSSDPTLTPQPTDQPSTAPSTPPTVTPNPTLAPTQRPLDSVASVQFLISLRDGQAANYTRDEYIPDLQRSLEELAEQFALEISDEQGRLRRRLTVSISSPVIDGVIIENCPGTVSVSDSCEEVSASIGMFVEDEDAAAAQASMETKAADAVSDGQLQDALLAINPNTPITVLGGPNTGGAGVRAIDDGSPSQDLGAGPIVGVVAAGLLAILVIFVLLARRRRGNNETEQYVKQPHELADEDHLALETPDGPLHIVDTGDSFDESMLPLSRAASPARSYMTGGAGSGGSGNVTRISAAAIATGAAGRYVDQESTSAGSSGWSSRDGHSSVDESSHASDDIENLLRSANEQRKVTNQARILQAASFTSDHSNRSDGDGDEIATTFSELDHAIHRGDWAAVGVTAALLASVSQESMSSDYTIDSPIKSRMIDAHRAAELDRLVAAGDWEAVVAAAGRFDSEEVRSVTMNSRATHGSQSTMSVESGSGVDSTGSGTAPSNSMTGTSVGGTTLNTSGDSRTSTDSRVKRRSEYRAEIQSLVGRVVPDEAENVDEMMVQFRGREEELVETLRTMHERQVAKRARLAGHKQAKRAARSTLEDKTEPMTVKTTALGAGSLALSPESVSGPVAFVSADGEGDRITERAMEKRSSKGSNTDDRGNSMVSSNLISAIESGDWDNVAAMGARINDHDDTDSGGSRDYQSSNSSTTGTDGAEGAGGWAGVVETIPRQEVEIKDIDKKTRRLKRLQEEEDALAQADIWIAIAEHAKGDDEETAANMGASEAADWAIARSLNALVQAQDSGQLMDSSTSSRQGRSVEKGKKG